MKIGEALSLLKKEKSRLSRLISLRKENVFVEKGKEPQFSVKNLTEEINKKTEDIRKLKIKLQKTNQSTKILDDNLTLAEAIIRIDDIRKNISNLSELFEKRSLFRDKNENEIPVIEQKKIEEEIEKLQTEKTKLDNKIQQTNWSSQIID